MLRFGRAGVHGVFARFEQLGVNLTALFVGELRQQLLVGFQGDGDDSVGDAVLYAINLLVVQFRSEPSDEPTMERVDFGLICPGFAGVVVHLAEAAILLSNHGDHPLGLLRIFEPQWSDDFFSSRVEDA